MFEAHVGYFLSIILPLFTKMSPLAESPLNGDAASPKGAWDFREWDIGDGVVSTSNVYEARKTMSVIARPQN
jgi:hypothetical protein